MVYSDKISNEETIFDDFLPKLEFGEGTQIMSLKSAELNPAHED